MGACASASGLAALESAELAHLAEERAFENVARVVRERSMPARAALELDDEGIDALTEDSGLRDEMRAALRELKDVTPSTASGEMRGVIPVPPVSDDAVAAGDDAAAPVSELPEHATSNEEEGDERSKSVV